MTFPPPQGPRKVREVRYRVTPDAAGHEVLHELSREETGLAADNTLETTIREVEVFLACHCPATTAPRHQCQAPGCAAIVCQSHLRTCARDGHDYCQECAVGAPGAEGIAPWYCADCYTLVFPPSVATRVWRYLWGR